MVENERVSKTERAKIVFEWIEKRPPTAIAQVTTTVK